MKDEWLHDHINPGLTQLHRIKKVIYSGKSQYQSVQFIDSESWGRCLILDGKIQSSELDEGIYHETLVHPPMIAHSNPERVLIAGGGEGATLREVLAYKSVKRAVMVDLDREVVDLCRKYLPSFHQGSFDDSRVELIFDDARKYLEKCDEQFDVIVLDLPEPIEGGPAYLLSTREFYQSVRGKLAPNGVVSLQAGASTWGNHRCFTAIVNTLKSVFPKVYPYEASIPSYCGMWGFAVATDKVRLPAPVEVDRRISSRVDKPLRYYDGLTHQGLFCLSRHLRQAIAEEKTVITVDKPFYIYSPED